MEQSFEDFVKSNPDVSLDEAFKKFKSLNVELSGKQLREAFLKAVDSFYKENPNG